MRVLVLNAGSSSLKAQVVDSDDGTRPLATTVERIAEDGGDAADHDEAVGGVLDEVRRQSLALDAVGHRVVHGGERFDRSVLVDDDVRAGIERCVPLAPLHNPANLAGIAAARRALPDLPQVAVFDTAFHATLPPAAYRYAVPGEWYEQHGVRRYGFHGTSHAHVARRAAALLDRPPEALALVTAHLGNGASVCAVDGGRSVDTSMGLGPLAGLVMGTRSGDLDPTVVFHLVEEVGLSLDDVEQALNRRSGLLALAGSNDLRDVERAAADGHEGATLALEVMVHRLVGYVAAYAARMGRLDALVFTGGIGEHSPLVRARTGAGLALLGVAVDDEANDAADGEARVDAGRGPAVLVVPTDEEGEIARETAAVVAASGA